MGGDGNEICGQGHVRMGIISISVQVSSVKQATFLIRDNQPYLTYCYYNNCRHNTVCKVQSVPVVISFVQDWLTGSQKIRRFIFNPQKKTNIVATYSASKQGTDADNKHNVEYS